MGRLVEWLVGVGGPGAVDVSARRLAGGLLAIAVAASALGWGCGGAGEPAAPSANGEPPAQAEQQAAAEAEQTEASGSSSDFTLELPIEYVGEHLASSGFEVGLDFWLEASEDATLSGLPGRAKASAGLLFQPSLDSPTGETFWVHVITDESAESASAWVNYLASQPPQLARFIVPQHELFGALFRPAPAVGDAAVSIDLLHGHSGGCWQSQLLVFAQDGAIVFLKSALEITREDGGGSAREPAALCDESGSVEALTDIEAIAELISERLAVGG